VAGDPGGQSQGFDQDGGKSLVTAPRTIRVIAFPGAPNLPLFAAEEHDFFREADVALSFRTTPSSVYQAEKLAAGEFDVAFTAFDNIVAYGEGQGAVNLPRATDFCVVMGATQLEISLVAQPEIATVAALKGKSIALDAVSTGFAFIFYDMLERNGLAPSDCTLAPVGATPQRWQSVIEGKHAATLTIEPFTSIARAKGFTQLDVSTRNFKAYQGGTVASTRSWASGNADLLTDFIRAYLKGLDWTLDPSNRDAATTLLAKRMSEIPERALPAVMESLLSPRSGLTPRGEILPEGMAQVLALRSRYGGGAVLTDWRKYLATEFHEAAIAGRSAEASRG
jgi:ABC-type nitrate/sulfonate/bicarbonate transport system substrate-binding protein